MRKHHIFVPLLGLAVAGVGCGTMDQREAGMQAGTYQSGAQTAADPSGTGGWQDQAGTQAQQGMQGGQQGVHGGGQVVQGQQGHDMMGGQQGAHGGGQAMQQGHGQQGQQAHDMHGGQQGMHAGGQAMQSDAEFYRKALASGRSEVALSERVASAGSGEVAELARRIARDHTQLNQQLQQASGMTQMPQLDQEQQTAAQRMQAMSGTQLERAYLDRMAQTHAKSIELYQRTAQSAQDARARQLAEAALPTLREHAQAVQRLRQQQGQR